MTRSWRLPVALALFAAFCAGTTTLAACPTVAGVATYQFATGATTHNVPGLSPSSGQLQVVIFASENGGTDQTTPAGWTQLAIDDFAANNTGGSGRLGVYAKVADGTEGTNNVNFATAAARTGAAIQYVFSGWGGTLGTDVSVSNAVIPQTSDPGSVTAAWGSADNLFLATAAIFDDDLNYTAAPTNYGSLQNVLSGNGVAGTGAGLGSAVRCLTAGSDDPGTFTVDVGSGTFEFATTLVIKPSGVIESPVPRNMYNRALMGSIEDTHRGALHGVSQ